jgi:hypothetical protein
VEKTTTLPVDPIIDMTPTHETRPFFNTQLNLTFNLDEIRRDRKHELVLQARFFTKADEARKSTIRFDGAYQKMFPVGWHEVWVKSRATIETGEILFFDEIQVGSDFLRGPFGSDLYVHKIGALLLEMRFSISRDIVKVSAFHDFAVFGRLDRTSTRTPVGFANAFGAGLHILFLDAFQLDGYFGVGFDDQGKLDKGLVVRIEQAF